MVMLKPGFDDGIDILDPFDLPEELFHGLGDPLLHFFGRGPGIGDKDIDHGNDDLRLFLARGDNDGKEPEQKRGNHDERRQLRLDKCVGNLAGNPDAIAHLAAPPAIWPPSTTLSSPAVTIRSPALSPERISIPPS